LRKKKKGKKKKMRRERERERALERKRVNQTFGINLVGGNAGDERLILNIIQLQQSIYLFH